MATTRSSSGFADQVGRVLGDRYRLVAPIGTGASAQVHLADDVRLGRRVAVKVLHPALAADETFLRRFRAEARAAAALSHPNIMAVYDWGDGVGSGSGQHGDAPYLVLELLSGGSLRSMLDTGRNLTLSQALVVGLEAGRALEAAHRSGFVHRDIKPANLLFGADSRLRIADFGLARALSEAAWTEPGDGLVGTARYAAPEQASGGRVDGKADVYALALVLIEAVTGSVPSVADSALATIRLRADEAIPVPDELGVIKPLLERCLQPDPVVRPDAHDVVQSLLLAARALERPAPLPLVGIGDELEDADPPADDDATVLPTPATVDMTTHAAGTPAARPPRRRWWRWVVALAVVVAAVVGAALLWSASQPPSAEVPNVAGQPVGEAEEEIERAQAAGEEPVAWDIRTEDEFSDGVDEGIVIRTEPPGGTDLEDESRLTLVVSLGPEPVPVPSLVDVDEAAARAAIEAAELELGNVTPEFSETIAAGLVTGWSVDGQEKPTESPKGSSVDIRISDGPAPRTVPELRGAPRADAEAELADLGLGVDVREEFSDDVEAGVVMGTAPAAGEQVARGETVTLIVSKGPDLVAVPDVIGSTYSEAYDVLTAAGFEVVPEGRGNNVVETDPEAGTRVRRGSEIVVHLRR